MHEADGGRAANLKMRANCNLDKFRPDIIARTITSPVHVTSILLKISEGMAGGHAIEVRRTE